MIRDITERKTCGDARTEILTLSAVELQPCIGCGGCYKHDFCVQDTAFNSIYEVLCRVDALFIVSAHYAPIPAKLSMLLEKIEQLAFLKRFHNELYRSPLFGKHVGIVAHGGGTEETHRYYQGLVIDSIWNALSWPVEMNVIGVDEKQPRGVTFPVKTVGKADGSVFPVQEYDWEDIRTRLAPLVYRVIRAARQRAT